MLVAGIDIVETTLGGSYTRRRLRKIPLVDNTVGRRILDIS